jgi:hypothetical protein
VITRNLTRIGSCTDLKAYSKKRITDYILNHIKSVARKSSGHSPVTHSLPLSSRPLQMLTSCTVTGMRIFKIPSPCSRV